LSPRVTSGAVLWNLRGLLRWTREGQTVLTTGVSSANEADTNHPKENIVSYLYEKRSELRRMRFRDLLLAKAVADIHRHCVRQQNRLVPIWSIDPIHGLDRAPALVKLKARTEVLESRWKEILRHQPLTRSLLLNILPSVSGIKVIYADKNRFIGFEGNGRLAALKEVCTRQDELSTEVEVYRRKQPAKVLRRVRRVLKRNFQTPRY